MEVIFGIGSVISDETPNSSCTIRAFYWFYFMLFNCVLRNLSIKANSDENAEFHHSSLVITFREKIKFF